MTHHPDLEISPEVQTALAQGLPVVALESTIISHGMPYPQNVQTALRVEAEVRAHGAVPATIAIINGKLKAGLAEKEIETLGQLAQGAIKVSRRDLALVVAARQTGATTVATTMIVAALAGIRIFATGGIGGVHRNAQNSFDISADLQELAQTPVAVVCAGAKSILDLGLTLEYLETHGVPVVGYQTRNLPAFFSRESAFALECQLDTPEQIAKALHAQWRLRLAGVANGGGMVIANPIPTEFALPASLIDRAIDQALVEAQQQGIRGKATTPFLLERVNAITGGDSLAANIGLVLNNARLAAQIAVALAAIDNDLPKGTP